MRSEEDRAAAHQVAVEHLLDGVAHAVGQLEHEHRVVGRVRECAAVLRPRSERAFPAPADRRLIVAGANPLVFRDRFPCDPEGFLQVEVVVEAEKILDEVSALLDDGSMAEMNWRVDGNKEEPKDVARDFLKKYEVEYIVLGQLEQAAYTPEGIAKFERWDGSLWKEVYREGQTTIYEVMP